MNENENKTHSCLFSIISQSSPFHTCIICRFTGAETVRPSWASPVRTWHLIGRQQRILTEVRETLGLTVCTHVEIRAELGEHVSRLHPTDPFLSEKFL